MPVCVEATCWHFVPGEILTAGVTLEKWSLVHLSIKHGTKCECKTFFIHTFIHIGSAKLQQNMFSNLPLVASSHIVFVFDDVVLASFG